MNTYTFPIGFVILNYKTWQKTVSCVQSIMDTYQEDKVVVIVDNDSPNESFENLTTFYKTNGCSEVNVIKTDKNGGFSYGNNWGVDYIVDNYPSISKIIITNNDVIFDDLAIENLIEAFNYPGKVVMTAPSIRNMSGEKTNAPWKKKPTILQELNIKNKVDCAYKFDELEVNIPVYMVSGCCFAVDRDYFLSVGKFDDNVFLYNEENIFAMKFSNKKLKIIYCPSANIFHDHGTTTGNKSVFVDKEVAKSTLYFMQNYENLCHFNIFAVKCLYIFRIILKKIARRYDKSNNLKEALIEIIRHK